MKTQLHLWRLEPSKDPVEDEEHYAGSSGQIEFMTGLLIQYTDINGILLTFKYKILTIFQVLKWTTLSFMLSNELLLSLKKALEILLDKLPMKAQTELKKGHRFGIVKEK